MAGLGKFNICFIVIWICVGCVFGVCLTISASSGTTAPVSGESEAVVEAPSSTPTAVTPELEFIPPPKAMDEFLECLLHPGVIVGNQSEVCEDYTGDRFSDKVGMLSTQYGAFLDYSSCPAKSNIPDNDARALLFDPSAVFIRPNSTDGFTFMQVFCMEFGFLREVMRYVPRKKPITLLDAGSNAGYASYLFSRLMRFQGELLSVEMNPSSVRSTRRNLAALAHLPGFRHRVVHSALVSVPQKTATPEVEFMVHGESHFIADRLTTVGDGPGGYATVPVPSVTLPELRAMADGKAFDFIKLDIEGAELGILKDPKSHSVLCAARCIFAELHERFEPGIDDAWAEFVASGCAEGRRMEVVVNYGEYSIACREDL